MAEFWFHSTFDESVEILRDILARFPVRVLHLPRQIDYTEAATSSTPELLDKVDDALAEALRARGGQLWLALPGVTPTIELKPSKSDPSLYVLANAQHFLTLALGRCQPTGRGMDAPLRCPNPIAKYDPIETENVFDDLVEGGLKPNLVQADAGGARYWLTPDLREATKSHGGLAFGGVLPRRRMMGMGNPRIVHNPPKGKLFGTVSAPRGSRPAVEIEYEQAGKLYRARTVKEGPDEHLIELLEVLARVVQAGQGKIVGLDEKLDFLLAEERRFGAVRAPPPPRAGAAHEVEVPAALARLCRDALYFHASGGQRLDSPEGHIQWTDAGAEVSYIPSGRLARTGYEQDVRWTFVVDAEALSRIGNRQERRVAVKETVVEPDETAKRGEIERIFQPLVADGAIRFVLYGLPYDRLKQLCGSYFAADKDVAREAAFTAIVDALETSLGVQLIRLEELRWALDQPPMAAGAAPRVARLPDRPAALAEHPELAAILAALRAGAAHVTLVAAVRVGSDLRVAMGPEHSQTIIEQVLPFIRNGEPPAASLDHVLFEIDEGSSPVVVAVPRRAIRAVPALRTMIYAATQSRRPAGSANLPLEAPAGEPWSLTVTRRFEAGHARSLTLHASGAAWFTHERRAGAPPETFWCLPIPYHRFRSFFDALASGDSPEASNAIETKHERRYGGRISASHASVSAANETVSLLEAMVERAHDV